MKHTARRSSYSGLLASSVSSNTPSPSMSYFRDTMESTVFGNGLVGWGESANTPSSTSATSLLSVMGSLLVKLALLWLLLMSVMTVVSGRVFQIGWCVYSTCLGSPMGGFRYSWQPNNNNGGETDECLSPKQQLVLCCVCFLFTHSNCGQS